MHHLMQHHLSYILLRIDAVIVKRAWQTQHSHVLLKWYTRVHTAYTDIDMLSVHTSFELAVVLLLPSLPLPLPL
jgi:hypothetical protein